MKANAASQKLSTLIRSRKAKVAVLGLGYVGLPLAVAVAKKRFRVIGIDPDLERVEQIRRGRPYVEGVASREIGPLLRKNRLEVTGDFERLAEADVILICVPTPLNQSRDPDLSYILRAAKEIEGRLRPGQLVVLESTTYPGTTQDVVRPMLEQSGLRAGEDFFLCFSPERVDPGNQRFPLTKIPKVVGGVTPSSTEIGERFYQQIMEKVVPVSHARTAEMAKLLENTFRIVNIGLVNELAQVARALDIDIWEAIKAASTKPFGFMPFYPGPGIGGHCIAIDPIYLAWKAKIHGVDIQFIDLARRVNAQMPRYVVERTAHLLNERSKRAVSGAKILLLGVTYKPDVRDSRESPALEIMERLRELGAEVSYHDPYVPEITLGEVRLRSEALRARNIRTKHLVLITTHHSRIPYGLLAEQACLIFDTRNVKHPAFRSPKVVRL